MNAYEALARLLGPALEESLRKPLREAEERRIEDMAVVK